MGCVFGKINEVYPSGDSLQPSVDTVLRCSNLCSDVYNTKNDVLIVSNLTSKYIVFEGTDTLLEWINNFACLRVLDDIHRGFYRYTKYCVNKYRILDEINDINYDRIVITAHSLGAACVIISLILLIPYICDNRKIEVVIFGCPRPGGKRFANRFKREILNNTRINIRFISICNKNDIVCSLPPKWCGYEHVENPIVINNGNNCSCVRDHKIQKYTECLMDKQLSNNVTI